jgi:hypothetical protein
MSELGNWTVDLPDYVELINRGRWYADGNIDPFHLLHRHRSMPYSPILAPQQVVSDKIVTSAIVEKYLGAGVTIDDVDISHLGAQVIANTAAIALNTTHRSSDGSDHTYIDQAVTAASSPSFADVSSTSYTLETVGGVAAANVTNIATNVTNIATNVTAIALNTTHRGSNGSDHSYLDQAVTIASTPTFANVSVGVGGSFQINSVGFVRYWAGNSAIGIGINAGSDVSQY